MKAYESVESIAVQNAPGTTIDEGDRGVVIQNRDQAFQEPWIGIIVRFGDPYVLPAREPNALIPLLIAAAGIALVKFDSHTRRVCIPLKNRPAVISRAVVQENQLKILIG